jgi:hypothetical protein
MTDLDTNPTQLTGLLAFALATAACVIAARRGGAQRARWWRMAALQALCFLEVLLGFRHRAHDLVDALLQARGWYAARGPLQVALLAAALCLAALTFVALIRLRRVDTSVWTAAAATAAALWLFAIEMVSLHAVDAVMYIRLGPLLLIGACWAACAAVVAWAALRSPALSRGSAPARRR